MGHRAKVIRLAQSQTTKIADPPKQINEESTALFARAAALLAHKTFYLDPDLNLTRLARQLHVRVKKLSAAINQNIGENVSRLINRYQIEAVCRTLRAGDTLTTQAIFDAGVSTKSNFNAEFLRVSGASPRDWLANTPKTTAMQR